MAEEEAQAVEIGEMKKIDTTRDEAMKFTLEQPSAEVLTPLISSPEEYRAFQERRRTLARQLLERKRKNRGGVRPKPRRKQVNDEASVTLFFPCR